MDQLKYGHLIVIVQPLKTMFFRYACEVEKDQEYIVTLIWGPTGRRGMDLEMSRRDNTKK